MTSFQKLRKKRFRMEIILEMQLERRQRWRGRCGLQGGEDRSLQAKVTDMKAWSQVEGGAPFGLMGTVGEEDGQSRPLVWPRQMFALTSADSESLLGRTDTTGEWLVDWLD